MQELELLGFLIIVVGFVMLLAATVSSAPAEEGERRTNVKGGGVIMIGPIPIVFGSDAKWASVAMLLALVLIIVVIAAEVLGV